MSIKSERVAELIHNHLSQLLLMEVRDPRLQGLTITDVRLDREIEHATIYINALGEEDRQDEVLDALDRAQGFLRSELASRLRLRRMPQLHFEWDVMLSQAMHIESVLDALKDDQHDDESIETDRESDE